MALTRYGLFLAALILLIGAAGTWIGGPFALVWRALAAAYLIGVLVEGLWSRKVPLAARWVPPPRTRLGVPGRIAFELDPTARACDLQLHLVPAAGADATPRIERLRLSPREGALLPLDFDPQRLGRLAWPRIAARLHGRFGLAWWPRRLGDESPMDVEPDVLRQSERAAAGSPEGQALPRRPGAGFETWGLREYHVGDALRQIDWKATARLQRMLVRETVEDQHLDVVIVLDAGRAGCLHVGRLSRLHHHVNVACRFAERAARFGDRLALVVLQGGVLTRLQGLQGTSGLRRLRSAVSSLQPKAVESSGLAGALAVRSVATSRALVVWLSEADAAGSAALEEAARLLAGKHLPLFVQLLDPDVAALAQRTAASEADAFETLAARQWIEGQQRAAQRLRRLGCEVVAAPAALLESSLVSRYFELREKRRV
jgi:uncharacterized protein (DUF58 family)